MKDELKIIFKGLNDLVFPPRCPCCGDVGTDDEPCEDCRTQLNKCRIFTDTCHKCGNRLRLCDCGKFNNLFTGISGAFWNKDVARDAVYKMKFWDGVYATDYFGRQAALSFLRKFPDVRPDLVVAVPATKRSIADRGYNQAELMAKSVAKRLELPFDSKILIKIKENRKQHDLGAEERRANVKGVYRVTTELHGKTVLLVDDIKTTGLTLSECAKQLRLNGADEVYTAVALITEKGTCNLSDGEI